MAYRINAGLAAVLALATTLKAQNPTARGAVVDKGSFKLHIMLEAAGEERYEVTRSGDASMAMNVSYELSDRGNTTKRSAKLIMGRDFTPQSFEINGGPERSVVVHASTAAVHEMPLQREMPLPPQYFVGFGRAPYSVQAMMMRYWIAHGRPARLPILRADPGAEDVEVTRVGRDSMALDGRMVRFTRYIVSNVVFGHEVLWLNSGGQLAAVLTFAGRTPTEAVRAEYESGFPQLFRSGVSEEMRIGSSLETQTTPELNRSFAITGATLVDGTGRSPIPDSMVIIRDGRILNVGSRSQFIIPKDMTVVDAQGKMVLPGLWDMHAHFTGVEMGPAYLAAGVTTAIVAGNSIF